MSGLQIIEFRPKGGTRAKSPLWTRTVLASSEDDIFSKGISGKTNVVKHNNTEQFKEATKIKEFMAQDPTIEPYLSSKSHVTEKTIDKIRNEVKQKKNVNTDKVISPYTAKNNFCLSPITVLKICGILIFIMKFY